MTDTHHEPCSSGRQSAPSEIRETSEPTRVGCYDTEAQSAPTETVVLDALRQVIDPEIGCNLVDLGMIYHVAINDRTVRVTMTLTSPGCPMSESIAAGVQNALLALEPVTDAQVELTFDPPWHPTMMTEAGREMTGTRF